MKKPLDEIKLGDYFEDENTIRIEIYEEFVSATVSLTSQESSDAMDNGGVPAERQALHNLLKRIFNEQKENMIFFPSAIDFNTWKNSVTFEVEDLSWGAYSKTVIFLLNTANYEESLEGVIKYIKEKHDHFLNPRAKSETIAKSILGKYFKK